MRYIGWDTETYLIVKHRKATRLATPRFVCLTWAERGRDPGITKDRKEAVRMWSDWLSDPECVLIAHNLSYDVKVMLRLAREEGVDLWPLVFQAYEEGRMRDTMVREMLLDIAKGGKDQRGYALARIAPTYGLTDRSHLKKGDDVWRLRYNQLSKWPVSAWPQEAVDYAVDDAVDALEVFYRQTDTAGADAFGAPLIEDADDGSGPMVINEKLQTMGDFTFGLASSWGMAVDVEKAKELDAYYEAVVIELSQKLTEFRLMRPDGTQDKSAIQAIVLAGWEELGLDPVLTPSGKKKIEQAQKKASDAGHDPDSEAFKAIVREGLLSGVSTSKKDALEPLQKLGYSDPAFKILTEYNRAVKFRSTYLEPIVDAYPYAVCPGYNILVDSGRSSSWGPNVQNIPARGKGAEIRNAFIPRPGNAFAQCDYSSMELRTLAQVCLNLGLDSHLAKALRGGLDPHLDFACDMNGWDYEWALGVLSDAEHPQYKEVKGQRQLAKVANFGFPGGLGAAAFVEYAASMGTEVTLELAQQLRDAWFKKWPEMIDYFAYINACSRYDGRVPIQQHGPYGHVGGWRTRLCDRYTSACNTLFQGLAADAIKYAMWTVTKASMIEPESPLFGFRICAMIHDELILEGPTDRAEAAAQALSEHMIAAAEIFCPGVPILAEPEVMWDCWAKG